MSGLRIFNSLIVLTCLSATTPPASANVITDWDEIAENIVTTLPPHAGQRMMAMVDAAMFDAVNAIDRRYAHCLAQRHAAPGTSKEAAAAAAAATILATIDAKAAAEAGAIVTKYLASISDGKAKSDGVKLGEDIAAAVLQARANDGANAPDAYRPRTSAGVYVPTAITLGSAWPGLKPFALREPAQFRPPPPIALESAEWAADYNEIKDYGDATSARRSPQQTETARFWLMVGPAAYHPVARQLATAKHMSVIDSARFMALIATGLADAYIAVFDAKYHYNFWRPITAIRNGDIDRNPETDRVATWQPIANTPLHPEYPCAHCIASGTVAAIVEAVLGATDIPEVSLTSATLPGVTHRFTSVTALAREVADARIWAGFHYRFSTRVGTEMGRQIGKYAVKNMMQPVM